MTTTAKLACLLMTLLTPAFSHCQTINLTDGPGQLIWDTSISVGAPIDNVTLTHPDLPTVQHRREGWFAHLDFGPGFLHEFTNFTVTPSASGNQSTLTSTWMSPIGEPIILNLDYQINGVGPQQLPDLTWNGFLERPVAGSTIPLLDLRLYNIYDYDIGNDPTSDLAEVTLTTGPNTTQVNLEGDNSATGFRGAFNNNRYQVSEFGAVLSETVTSHTLNNTIAPGSQSALDAAGGFQWNIPNLGIGPGSGFGIGGFGGFGTATIPEPNATCLVALWLTACWGSRRRRR